MFTTYSGNSAYCFSNSLHMCLGQAGMAGRPSVSTVECMTGMPFSAAFFKVDPPLFFPSPATTDPDSGLTRALQTMGWGCELWQGDDESEARHVLEKAIEEGPALLGPLDLGYLPFDPNHARKRGSDHYVVALKREGELVQLHDPQLYPFAMLPLDDLVLAWNAKELGYSSSKYTLRKAFRVERGVSREQMLLDTLKAARALSQDTPAGPIAYGGAAAFTMAAETLAAGPLDALAGHLIYFALPLGARRCLDAAGFLAEAGKTEAARLMANKAEAYGRAQYHAVQKEWQRVAGLFGQLAALESQLAQKI